MKKVSKIDERLKELMEEREIKAEALGKILNINGVSIRYWFLQDTSLKLNSLIKLSDYFDCTIEYLIGRSEDDSSIIKKECPPFIERLKYVLKEKGKNFYSLDRDTPIKFSYHSRYGKGGEPLLNSLLIMADYVDCTIDYLIARE